MTNFRKLLAIGSVPLFAFSLSGAVRADDSAGTHCSQLGKAYDKYVGSETIGQGGRQVNLEARIAMEQCAHGNTHDGIATLERKLREGKVVVPPQS